MAIILLLYMYVHVGKTRKEHSGIAGQFLGSPHQPKRLDCDGCTTRTAEPLAGQCSLHHWRQTCTPGYTGGSLPQLHICASRGEEEI